ncbi:phospholipase [Pseudonocardiaceae bacterium YIM PH 21723]|nr:phospholipase [Pseudonocardiaceae bacterium YIM PH 21723]
MTKVAVAVLATMLVFTGTAQAAASPQALSPQALRSVTDGYLLSTTLGDFDRLSNEKPYPDQLDWTNDGCTAAPDHPWGYDFVPACKRHDFGYANYKRQGRFSETTRLVIDDQFKADMFQTCGDRSLCRSTAEIYYQAVRKFGGIYASTNAAIHARGRQSGA